jgi:hypothetical protein
MCGCLSQSLGLGCQNIFNDAIMEKFTNVVHITAKQGEVRNGISFQGTLTHDVYNFIMGDRACVELCGGKGSMYASGGNHRDCLPVWYDVVLGPWHLLSSS